ncbi:rhomboid family intramembrane serine protease [Clostridium sporogenes]|uniref:Rhomboid family intramembrane serine protease n=1 Tax=Clostridium botulinum TaxID=1491 RepID=A0A6M0SZN4_CLOBO|nr:rhomboid family intramembrane serine protease [Clostridium sporogenes]NFA60968.1 rhomboid family intramembrane serine protease [Clostridium botulinum]NFI75411.1 rhomboid family intramembrane serine protease [Clostridium sporogenes]NFL73663.1 rhomboid family intramembrane serine protease [Clostridium sporogenes]NFM25283.1 rhomboid family intramembrane serine protease [Clostridium sporogenes]NFP63388.1 rhomboid family intramembrane serine protease [Clostridium sporogenes]
MMDIDKFIKDIIEKLIRENNYRVMEISTNAGLESSWIAVNEKEDFYDVLIFSSNLAIKDLNREYIKEYIQSLFINKPINLNIAVLIDKEIDSSLINFLDINLIKDISFVLDYNNRSIVYAGEGTRSIVEDIVKVPKEKENIYYKENNIDSHEKATITKIIIGINIFMYLITAFLSKNILSSDIRVLVFLGAKANSFINNGEYYRLITSMFLHGGLIHLALNMYALNSIGPLIENYFGKVKYLIIYFISGILSSYFSYLFSPSVSIGASGAIFGVLGATLIIAYKNRKRGGKEFLNNIISVIVVNLILGFSIPNVDNFGHIGGLIGGIIVTLILINTLER